jgi:hypothetical protein
LAGRGDFAGGTRRDNAAGGDAWHFYVRRGLDRCCRREWLRRGRRGWRGLGRFRRGLSRRVGRFRSLLLRCRLLGRRLLYGLGLFRLHVAAQPLGVGLAANAISLWVFDARGMGFDAYPERDAQIEALFVRQSKLFGELVYPDLLLWQESSVSLFVFVYMWFGFRFLDKTSLLSSHTTGTAFELFDGITGDFGLQRSTERLFSGCGRDA